MELFPIRQPNREASSPQVGLAKIAAASPTLGQKQKVQYLSLACRTILNRCDSPRMPFTWTINPYRGCEFGCKYCYARYTHEYLGMENPADFEERIYSKERAGEILGNELGKDPAGAIAIGTATDPYQPAERQFQTTRHILEILSAFRGLRISLTTKSDLVRRDLDVLRAVAAGNELQVNLTVTTLHVALARALEPRAPRPDLRLVAAREIANAGIPVGVYAMPVLPGITDDPRGLEAIAQAASRVGACHFAVNALFLMPSAQKAFFPFLESEFPHLVERYRRWYARGAYLRGRYVRRLQQLAGEWRAKYGLREDGQKYPAASFAPLAQLSLFPPLSSVCQTPRAEQSC